MKKKLLKKELLKKLALSKETLRNLQSSDLRDAVGGASTPCGYTATCGFTEGLSCNSGGSGSAYC